MVEPFGDCARELAVATVEGTTGGPRAQADLFVSGVEDLDCVDALTGLLISANPKKFQYFSFLRGETWVEGVPTHDGW